LRRHRIARQRQDERASGAPEGQRLAWLDRYLPKAERRARRFERRTHQVVIADADSAYRYEQITAAQASPERLRGAFEIVDHGVFETHFGAGKRRQGF
jgi:hypothetical protein